MAEFTTLMNTLETALSLKRRHGSVAEAMFVAWLSQQVTPTLIDGAGNIHVIVGKSRTIFTAHTDTVHRAEGVNKIRKTDTHWYGVEDPLGADDGCGVAILLHLISNNVPGRYIFFRGEECGGIGSKWLAGMMPEMLKQYDRAVAFDRANKDNVITFQGGSRCCSDTFADALAEELNKDGFMYMADDTGVYTDTAEFKGLIPECTNLSVGYAHQHGPNEEVDIRHLLALAAVAVNVNWETLPTERDPKGIERKTYNYGGAHSFRNNPILAKYYLLGEDEGIEGFDDPVSNRINTTLLDAEDVVEETEEIEAMQDLINEAYNGDYLPLLKLMAKHMTTPEYKVIPEDYVRRVNDSMLDDLIDNMWVAGPRIAFAQLFSELTDTL